MQSPASKGGPAKPLEAPPPPHSPQPFYFGPVESENNEPAPVSVFSPDNKGREKKEKKRE